MPSRLILIAFALILGAVFLMLIVRSKPHDQPSRTANAGADSQMDPETSLRPCLDLVSEHKSNRKEIEDRHIPDETGDRLRADGRRTSSVGLRVLDQSGRPIVGARVRSAEQPTDPIHGGLDEEINWPETERKGGLEVTAFTNEQGIAQVTPIPMDRPTLLGIDAAGFARTTRVFRSLGEQETFDLGGIVLAPGKELAIHVRTNSGVAVADLEVSLYLKQDPEALPGRPDRVNHAITDSAGIAVFRNAPFSQATAAIWGWGFLDHNASLDFGLQQRAAEWELDSGELVLGRVVDEEGRPIGGAHVNLWRTTSAKPDRSFGTSHTNSETYHSRIRTDGDGRFIAHGAVQGMGLFFSVLATPDDYVMSPVFRLCDEVEVVMPNRYEIRGKLGGSGTGLAADVRIHYRPIPVDRRVWDDRYSLDTPAGIPCDADASFTLLLQEGAYEL